MLQRMYTAYGIVASQFKQRLSPLVTFTGFILLHGLVTVGLVADRVFFPALRRTKISGPIVIVGNPRSGTTFLHRFLVEHELGAGMRIWKMLYPSPTLQVPLQPLLPLLEKISPARHHAHAAHETNLTAIETDDPSLLFRYFDGLFLYGFFYAWSKTETLDGFEQRFVANAERDFNWYESLWRRNLVSEKRDRVVAKLFSLSLRLPQFLRRFPDAKVLYMVRDPLETVPSGLSLVTGVLDGRFGFWSLPLEQRQHFIENMYAALLRLSLRFHEDYTSGRIPPDNLYIVTFPRLMQQFDVVMDDILKFVDVEPSAELKQTIRSIADKQRRYKSAHQYDLARFGLTEERIRRDYAVIYDTFLQDASLNESSLSESGSNDEAGSEQAAAESQQVSPA
ncbi:sulfotransferase [Ketobacter sp.]|uniref:sulfotransferase n=1 Tax=Ketobacter sp. TaxID=2083498 RepID=UPI000F179344|nr:sulfotransferase [Ketobacter sp.]RLU00324.1 MAG: sulfotransferase [Ketobacter sp.]